MSASVALTLILSRDLENWEASASYMHWYIRKGFTADPILMISPESFWYPSITWFWVYPKL